MPEPATRPRRGPLAGARVLVTRPAPQARDLAAAIDREGGFGTPFPTVEIADPVDARPALAVLRRLSEFDIAVFISRNAVERGLALIDTVGTMPSTLTFAAVGEATARALAAHGLDAVLQPHGEFNTEALLALDALAQSRVAGKRVVIVRGEGGRELLSDTLEARGAEVAYAEVYRRVTPRADVGEIVRAGRAGRFDYVVVTSGDGLHNLFQMLGPDEHEWLRDVPYVVASERVRGIASTLGIRARVSVADNASDAAVVSALIDAHRKLERASSS